MATPIVMELTGVLSMLPNILDASLRESLSSKINRVVEFRREPGSLKPILPTRPIPVIRHQSAETFDALLVQAAIFKNGIFGKLPVGG